MATKSKYWGHFYRRRPKCDLDEQLFNRRVYSFNFRVHDDLNTK